MLPRIFRSHSFSPAPSGVALCDEERVYNGDLASMQLRRSYAEVGGNILGDVELARRSKVITRGNITGSLYVGSESTAFIEGNVGGRVDCWGQASSFLHIPTELSSVLINGNVGGNVSADGLSSIQVDGRVMGDEIVASSRASISAYANVHRVLAVESGWLAIIGSPEVVEARGYGRIVVFGSPRSLIAADRGTIDVIPLIGGGEYAPATVNRDRYSNTEGSIRIHQTGVQWPCSLREFSDILDDFPSTNDTLHDHNLALDALWRLRLTSSEYENKDPRATLVSESVATLRRTLSSAQL